MIKDKMHKHLNQVYYSMLARCYDENIGLINGMENVG